MDEQEELELIREFMLAIAPEVMHYESLLIDTDSDRSALPERVAAMSLNIAVRLAGKFRSCYDRVHNEANSPAPPELSP